jgi:acetyl-CoA acetyltransferase
VPHLSVLGLHLDAARHALQDAGVTPDLVDGIASTGHDPAAVAFGLGMRPTFMDSTMVGGSTPMVHVRHAVAALRAGLCSMVLVSHGESGRSRIDARYLGPGTQSNRGQFEIPYGTWGPPVTLTLGVLRYMKETGFTEEDLAMVAVTQREWAAKNPRAMRKEPLSIEDVLSSRMIAYPFHQPECCLVADGGGALLLTTEERAADLDLRHRPVRVIGTGEASEAPMVSMVQDFTSIRAFRQSGAMAFREAGVAPADVDHVMCYDAFAFLPPLMLEDLGFIEKGEAGRFYSERRSAPGGSLPVNTNGGGLSYAHTGMYGMFAIQESVRQLRGTAPAQVDGVELSVAHGIGGMYVSAATLVLQRGR